MVLILSDANDDSTGQVIEWLDFFNCKWFRIDAQTKIEIEYTGSEIFIKTKGKNLKLSEIKSFWYRRGYFNTVNVHQTNIPEFNFLQIEEIEKLKEYIFYKLNKKRHLNSFKNRDVNKLIISDIARKLEILTPNDFLFSNTINLKKMLIKEEQLYITKVVSGNCRQKFDDFTICNYTKEINLEDIESENIFPTLIQNKIEKKFELRIFYLDGKFYSMAIFSQKNEQTNVDFRNNNSKNLNRYVPYRIPYVTESKLHKLMKEIDINCGSIDMIVTPNNDYVFLEVNPVGQFGMVSYPCNFNLEKKIAEYLSYE